eukprot:1626289-Pleurochrysis_carterae.AAC.2
MENQCVRAHASAETMRGGASAKGNTKRGYCERGTEPHAWNINTTMAKKACDKGARIAVRPHRLAVRAGQSQRDLLCGLGLQREGEWGES